MPSTIHTSRGGGVDANGFEPPPSIRMKVPVSIRKSFSRASVSIAASEWAATSSVGATNRGGGGGGGGGSWAALMASAHEAYVRDRQMTTEERVEAELRKRARRYKERKNDDDQADGGDGIASGNRGSNPLTADALTELERRESKCGGGVHDDDDDDDDEDIADDNANGSVVGVPDMNYAVARLAKSLEESRKALRERDKEMEMLNTENEELRQIKGRSRQGDLKDQRQRSDKDWVSSEAHTKLRASWEEWADVAENKIDSLLDKLRVANEEKEELQATIAHQKAVIAKLEDKVKRFQGWTSPQERKVLDATIELLRVVESDGTGEAGKENCANCGRREGRIEGSRKVLVDVTEPLLRRGKTTMT